MDDYQKKVQKIGIIMDELSKQWYSVVLAALRGLLVFYNFPAFPLRDRQN